jgi:hypothetical protein
MERQTISTRWVVFFVVPPLPIGSATGSFIGFQKIKLMNPYAKTKCECCGKAVRDLHKFYQFTDEETGDSLYTYPLGPHLYALCEDCRVIAFTDYRLFYFILKGIDTRPSV